MTRDARGEAEDGKKEKDDKKKTKRNKKLIAGTHAQHSIQIME